MKNILKILKKYGTIGFLDLMIDLVKTKIIYKKWNPRIIRSGCRIRGSKFIIIGKSFSAGFRLRMDAFGEAARQIEIGNNVSLGDDVHLASIKKLTIGNDTLIASKVYISDHNHGSYSGSTQSKPDENINARSLTQKNVVIGSNVWIGESVSILTGASIGDNSIIGANSVVTKNIPPNSIAVGAPAKIIKKWSDIEKKWIDYRA